MECSNTCELANDGKCDDSRVPGGRCLLGTDCHDCGTFSNVDNPYVPIPSWQLELGAVLLPSNLGDDEYIFGCDDSCSHANNGVCNYVVFERGDAADALSLARLRGNDAEAYCPQGTDCSDCKKILHLTQQPPPDISPFTITHRGQVTLEEA